MENTRRKYNLEDRLVKFAVMALNVCDVLPNTRAGNNLEHQLSKSGTAPVLMYGEVLAAESQADNLRIIMEKPVVLHDSVTVALKECTELIAIFTASVATAKRNRELSGSK